MTTMTLSQSTQDAIRAAREQGPGTNNQNYVAAYNAISGDISSHGGFDPGTTYWFSLAGSINGQQFNPSPAGTFIYNYTKAAAQSEGTTLTQAQMQQASDKIAKTVFDDLGNNGYVFSDQHRSRVRDQKIAGRRVGIFIEPATLPSQDSHAG